MIYKHVPMSLIFKFSEATLINVEVFNKNNIFLLK